MKSVELAIVGGGAAGMFAAAVAAERGLKCVLIERKARLGSKVLMTANGRCNFTKDISSDQFLKDVGECAPFVRRAIEECSPRKIIAGFKSLNVPLRRMADGRMFPADGKAATIVHAFGDLLRDSEVPILVNCPVRGIECCSSPAASFAASPAARFAESPAARFAASPAARFAASSAARFAESSAARFAASSPAKSPAIKSPASPAQNARFILHTACFDLAADNVLLATGGVSYPKTGSVGDGQNFAKALGHTLIQYRPGLIGLETSDPKITRLAGRRFEDGRVKVIDENGATLFDCRGEVDCESFGLSGAAIYNCQRFIEHYCRNAADGRGSSSRGRSGYDDGGNSCSPSRGRSGWDGRDSRKCDLSIEVWFDRNRLIYRNLQPRPVKEAIVTIGGVDTREIDPQTMQSKLVPGLYFAGEVMDIDGPTGGYNLTLAFATARKAVASLLPR